MNINTLSASIEWIAKGILIILIAILLAVMLWMVLKSAFIIKGLIGENIHEVSKTLIVNVLMTLAVFEVFRIAIIYFSEGRVKVTYIIDTVLVVILTDVMAFWFREIEYQRLIMVIALVLTLIVARILAIRFSPAKTKEDI